ncbi:hypothetical protein KBZ18_11140 [Synechococcus sp. Cruz-9H2]|uniref:hypothetical protein n=1 Tax=unclassified Synechococcus TaxID=2626047 RepID=UPI0020CB8DA9|nr:MULTISPECIES: hypothetical protein [unclassified Synechococcus]MCP9820044.1 hypothetical protein [Synechococcus sp. Cruz-9H2]MCP9844350.1 hypothetical protein [Synechococcus sp. Edmonson 11F2]MCP9856474.1 hypothetical protein [Synechococcus sp. Cruz-9C9]MCP9863751.1 hypothetical protein [Synechococcus sp. Cruz-7E5]MCP9870954.1 hypothetical protein [Synechococcus sp. Cruz-7B9]
MTVMLAGVRTSSALDWQSSGGSAAYSQFFSRLLAFIATVNATPGNESCQLAVLKRNTDATDVRRGMVLRLSTPLEDWVLHWVHPVELWQTPTLLVGRAKNWLDDGSNGGYGSLLNVSATDPAVDCRNGGGSVMIPSSCSPGVLLWAQDTTPGAEWWLFHADSTVMPFDPNGEANGRPWTFLLFRQPGTDGWCVLFPGTTPVGCLLNTQLHYEALSSSTLSLSGSFGLARYAARGAVVSSNIRTAAGVVSVSERLWPLPPDFWMGRTTTGSDWAYPERLLQQFRTIDLDGSRLFLIGRPWFQMTWLQVQLADLPLVPTASGWTTFSAYSGWTAGMTDLVLVDGLPVFEYDTIQPLNGTDQAAYVPAAQAMLHPLQRAAFIELLEQQGGPGDGGPGGEGGGRPAAGVLWPRGAGT